MLNRVGEADESERVVAVLHHARALLAEAGWCRRTYTDDAGRLCLFAAVFRSTQPGRVRLGAMDALQHTIAPGRARDHWVLAQWNDTTGRTRRQVSRAIEQTITRLERVDDPR